MDHTKTPFGGRLLRSWVAHPLTDRQRINERLDAVEEMVAAGSAMDQGGQPQCSTNLAKILPVHEALMSHLIPALIMTRHHDFASCAPQT